MRTFHKILMGCGMSLGLWACQPTAHKPPPTIDLALINVAIIDVETGDVNSDRTVWIDDGRVIDITRQTDGSDRSAQREIQAEGAYLIPGLWDAHVHLNAVVPDGRKRIDPAKWHIPLALSYGVTGLRDLGSNMDAVLALRDNLDKQRSSGEAAPELVVAGTLFSGPQPWGQVEHGTYPETEEAARAQVGTHIERGVDFIKVHDFLDPDIYRAIVDEAIGLNQTVVGHLRSDVGPKDAIALGQRGFEHVPPEMLSFCRADGKARVRNFYDNWFRQGGPDYFHREMVNLYDADGCSDLFSILGAEGVTVTPTLTLRKPVSDVRFERAKIVAPASYLTLCEDSRDAERQIDPAVYDRYDDMMGEVVRNLSGAGVTLLAGTDRPVYNCGVPGWDLVQELISLVEAGLSPQEALAAATVDAADKVGADQSGTIKVGATADMVLLAYNPLEDVRALADPQAVISAGTVLERSDLLRMREQAAIYAKSLDADPDDAQ